MDSGPGPPPLVQCTTLMKFIAQQPLLEERIPLGRSLVELCLLNRQLLPIVAQSMEFLSLVPSLLELPNMRTFIVAFLSIAPPDAAPVIKILQQMLSTGNRSDLVLTICRQYLESTDIQDAFKAYFLVDQGMLSCFIDMLSSISSADLFRNLIRVIGSALAYCAAARQSCHFFNSFRLIEAAVLKSELIQTPENADPLILSFFLSALHQSSSEFDALWNSDLSSLSPGIIGSIPIIPIIVKLLPYCSNCAQRDVFSLLQKCLSQFEINVILMMSLPSITDAFLVQFSSILQDESDLRWKPFLSLLKILLTYRPSPVCVNRFLDAVDKSPHLVGFLVEELLLPGAKIPFIQFDLGTSGASCMITQISDVEQWPPPKGYSIALWFYIDSQASDIHLFAILGQFAVFVKGGHLYLECGSTLIPIMDFEWVAGIWYHLVLTHERKLLQSSMMTVYVNGETIQSLKLPYPNTWGTQPGQSGASGKFTFVIGTWPDLQQPKSDTRWKVTSCTLLNVAVTSPIAAKWFALGRQAIMVGGAQRVFNHTAEYLQASSAIELALLATHPIPERSQHSRSVSLLSAASLSDQLIPGSSFIAMVHAQHSRIVPFPCKDVDYMFLISSCTAHIQDDSQSMGHVAVYSPIGIAAASTSVGSISHFLRFLSKSRTPDELNQWLLAITLLLRDCTDFIRKMTVQSEYISLASLLKKLCTLWDSKTVDLVLAIIGLYSRGKSGRIVNTWALDSLVMDMNVWINTSPTVQKLLITTLEEAIVFNTASQQNLKAIESIGNPVPRIVSVLGEEDLAEETEIGLTRLLGIFISSSTNPENFAIVCDSAIAAVQLQPSQSNGDKVDYSQESSPISVPSSPYSVNSPGSTHSWTASVKLKSHSVWADNRRHRLLEMLLSLVRQAFESGNVAQLGVYANSMDAYFICILVEGGRNPQRRTVLVALQLMNLFFLKQPLMADNFFKSGSFHILFKTLRPFCSYPEVFSMLLLMLSGRPYFEFSDQLPQTPLETMSVKELTKVIISQSAESRAICFPGAAHILVSLIVFGATHVKRPSIMDRHGSVSALRPSSIGVSRRDSNHSVTVNTQTLISSPMSRRSMSPVISRVPQLNIPDDDAAILPLGQVTSPALDDKRFSDDSFVYHKTHEKLAETSSRTNSSRRSKPNDAVNSDLLIDSIQAITEIIALSSSSSINADPLGSLYEISIIKQVADARFVFESDVLGGEHLSKEMEKLLVWLLYKTLFLSRSDPLSLLRRALCLVPFNISEAALNAYQSRIIVALFERISEHGCNQSDLQQNASLRSSFFAMIQYMAEHIYLGRYSQDVLEKTAYCLSLHRLLERDQFSASQGDLISSALLEASRRMILFRLSRRDQEHSGELYQLIFEHAHLLCVSDDEDFVVSVLYHATLQLINGDGNSQHICAKIWHWVALRHFSLFESLIVFSYRLEGDPDIYTLDLLENGFSRLMQDRYSSFLSWLSSENNRNSVMFMATTMLEPVWKLYESVRKRDTLDQKSERDAAIAQFTEQDNNRLERDAGAQVDMEFAVLHHLQKAREREVLRLLSLKQIAKEAEKANACRWSSHLDNLNRTVACQALSWTQHDDVPSVTWEDLWTLDLIQGPNRTRSKLKRRAQVHHELTIQENRKQAPSNELIKAADSKESPAPANKREDEFLNVPDPSSAKHASTQSHSGPLTSRRRPLNQYHSRSRLSSVSLAHLLPALHSPREASSESQNNDAVISDFWLRGEQRLKIMLEAETDIQAFYPCRKVIGLDEKECIFVLCPNSMSLIIGYRINENGDVTPVTPSKKKQAKSNWAHDAKLSPQVNADNDTNLPSNARFTFDQIAHLTKCRYLLHPSGLDISFIDGNNFLLVFSVSDRQDVYDLLIASWYVAFVVNAPSITESLISPRLVDPDSTATLFNSESSRLNRLVKATTNTWLRGQLSNFDYLMQLSLLSQRTFNDLTQYPVFPWVVQDFHSDALDLESAATFRDLRKPIGALDRDREQMFRDRYDSWEDDQIPKFNYGTHYSSAPVVLNFLVRLEPFTSQFKRLHSGRFDKPDRMFHDLGDCWNACSGPNAGTSDVRELLPEFYFMPEFLVNGKNLNLGIRSSGIETDNVVLPPWASGSPRKFISLHRQALESDYVSANIHHWIDLIYGYKQKGPAAVEACNTFYYTSLIYSHQYEGQVDFQSLENDPVRKSALIEQVRSFGQTPKQLFTKQHPARQGRTDQAHLIRYCKHIQLLEAKQMGKTIGCIGYTSDRIKTSPLFSALIGPANDIYATWGTVDGTVRFFSTEPESYARMAITGAHSPGAIITCVHVSTNGLALITGASDSSIVVFKRKGLKSDEVFVRRGTLDGHITAIVSLAISSEFSIIVSASADTVILIWDLNRLEPVANVLLPQNIIQSSIILSVDCMGNGDIGIGFGDGNIAIWDRNCHKVASTTNERVSVGAIMSLQFCSSHVGWSACLISGHFDGSIVVWFADFDGSIHCGRILGSSEHKSPITALTVSPDLNQFWSGDTAGYVLSWGIPAPILAELRCGPATSAICGLCNKKSRKGAEGFEFCHLCQSLYCSQCWLEHYRTKDKHKLSTVIFRAQ